MDHETTYSSKDRRGACSCGNWSAYDVSAREFAQIAHWHRAVQAERERRALPARRPESGIPTAFQATLDEINALPEPTP